YLLALRLQGKKLAILDLYPSTEALGELRKKNNTFIVLHHHLHPDKERLNKGFFHVDYNHCTAVIAWRICYPDKIHEQLPYLLDHIEDRELWKYARPWTRELTAGIEQHEPDNLAYWSSVLLSNEDDDEGEELCEYLKEVGGQI